MNQFLDKSKVDPEDSIVFKAYVLQGPISEIEEISKEIMKRKVRLLYQKTSGAYLYIVSNKPDEVTQL